MLAIVQAPHVVLAKQAQKVDRIDKTITSLLKEMEVTLDSAKDPEGVGLAAPQIGKSLQIFVIRQTPKSPLLIFINPVLAFPTPLVMPAKPQKKDGPVKLEGCLSLNNIWGVVHRQPVVTVTYLDENGKTRTRTCRGFLSTIVQHEYDHLQGVLFPKRVLEQKEKLYKSHKDEHGDTVFDEISL